MIDVKRASEIMKISEQRVRALLRSGQIIGRQIGKVWAVSSESVAEHMEKNGALIKDVPPLKKLPDIKALSFFSGAMGLDLGLEQAGINVILACEIDKVCRKTISANKPEIPLLGDIWDYSASEIRKYAGLSESDEIDVVVGGPPCQPFSTAGTRRGFKDERGNVLIKYIQTILELRPRYAVIENVRGLLSAPITHRPHAQRGNENPALSLDELPGGALFHIVNLLRNGGYSVSFNLYNAANFGVPQSRERVVIICNRDGLRVSHLQPTHSENGNFNLPVWRTLREALCGMEDLEHEHVNFPENRLRYYRLLKEGQYWKHLPDNLQKEAMGKSYFSGGGKTGFYRRLAWDKPSCTLVTHPAMPATDICHPSEDRPLSIAEYKRIQQFPDDWVFCGSILDRYKQIGNAVPVGLGAAVGRTIIRHMQGIEDITPANYPFSRYKNTDDASWEANVLKILESREKESLSSFRRA
ncbi:MAG: DNA cytosine methyltransferase [Micavibrio aeruginosavorus]|uniref:Cytosine-specific methyltransferase n=1 Tax=Micavibrio aeruginosavorus TaxID=349221 RepID=A0A7T5R4T8_9BACT|nr:MAG: DNA cytosine methyltransferase [Micavibrio aeruginosavorus]